MPIQANLFVRPTPHSGSNQPGTKAVPFQIIFIDFGMMGTVPQRLRSALRDYAIALGTRDARGIVDAYDKAGFLLPGADKRRLEEAHRDIFERFWGVGMSQMRDLALDQAEDLLEEYKDLVYDAPFQFQADMLFVGRAVGLLSGITTSLDPNFDPLGLKPSPLPKSWLGESYNKIGAVGWLNFSNFLPRWLICPQI